MRRERTNINMIKKSKPNKRKRLIRELINRVQEKTVQTVSKETRNQITNAVLHFLNEYEPFEIEITEEVEEDTTGN